MSTWSALLSGATKGHLLPAWFLLPSWTILWLNRLGVPPVLFLSHLTVLFSRFWFFPTIFLNPSFLGFCVIPAERYLFFQFFFISARSLFHFLFFVTEKVRTGSCFAQDLSYIPSLPYSRRILTAVFSENCSFLWIIFPSGLCRFLLKCRRSVSCPGFSPFFQCLQEQILLWREVSGLLPVIKVAFDHVFNS